MKIFINKSKVNIRARLSNFVSLGGLILLLASVLIPLFRSSLANIAYILMVVGMGMAMIGIYFANRWVRKPRPEESLAKALKSFDDKFALFHYPKLPCDHLLLTPTGVVAIEVINLAGSFSYKNGKWKEAMTIGRALRYIVEERVSNPILVAKQAAEDLEKLLMKDLDTDCSITVRPIVVFTHPLVKLDIENAPILVTKLEKLKKQITNKSARLSPELYDKTSAFLQRKTVNS